jgi:hypothetical protein
VLKLFREDPRARFRAVFDQMTDASEEMRKHVEVIGLKLQQDNHANIITKLAELEKDYQSRIDELRDVLIQKYQEESKAQLEKLASAQAKETKRKADEAFNRAEEQKKAKRDQLEELRPFLRLSGPRQAFWRILHKEPWTVIVDAKLTNILSDDDTQTKPWRYWNSGKYCTQYPIDDPVAEIILVIQWNAETDAEKPIVQWLINTPNSIFYPGKHSGRMEIRKKTSSSWSDVISSRITIFWESAIFSHFPSSDTGYLSSDGPLEDSPAPLILTTAIQSIAYSLVHGPFVKCTPKPLFGWHGMGNELRGYFQSGGVEIEDRCMRASAFFANAFTRDVEGLDAFGDVELPEHCREASVMAIRDLAEFFKIEDKIVEHSKTDESWNLVGSYAEAKSQEEWVEKDRQWAGRVADLAGLNALVRASKQVEDFVKVRLQPIGMTIDVVLMH